MGAVAFLIGWVVVPGSALALLAYLRRRRLRSGRITILILSIAVAGLAFFTGVADGASVSSSLVAGAVFGIAGSIFGAFLFVFVKLLGNDMPW